MVASAESLHALERVVLVLLVMVAAFAVIAHRLKVPYPIVLVLAGLVLSFSQHVPHIPLDPNLVFAIFLPPLLYGSAWTVSWREFRQNAFVLALLAVGLVGFTVWGVAEFSDRFITALDWKAGFLLGAVVSTTDAIAATSVAHALGLPRRVVDILEGESLLNDATGLLALEIGLSLLARGDLPTVGEGLARLTYLIVAGLVVGLLLGVVVGWLERYIDNGPVEVVLSLIVPYAAYLAGEEAKASGVLAVVACGLYMSRRSATFFSPGVRIQVKGAWEAMTFVLNGIVFALIGLQMPYVLAGIRGDYSILTLVRYGAVFSAMLIALRMVWVLPALKLANFIGRLQGLKKATSGRESLVIGWTGMRGVLALAAAVSVPEMINDKPFGPRNLIVFVTFSVILVTLVLQGLTLPSVIRALGLAGQTGMGPEERNARKVALEEALEYLRSKRHEAGEVHSHAFEDVIDRYRRRLEALGEDEARKESAVETTQTVIRLSKGALRRQRSAMIRMRNEGRISDDVLRTVERELDLEESRYLLRKS
ncbi:Na+/H+ antiporter [Edaphobacter bradus]|uniref:Na+/H+ antiporter n=1 Tax=Edaphobacter bradus TaxID=2259016 RepID=UPI0021E083E8|nr:Na+/H+ antiporter [Edaphobacter bradus]